MAEEKSGYSSYFQTFVPPPEIYHHMTAAESDLGHESLWKGFDNNHVGAVTNPSSSVEINDLSSSWHQSYPSDPHLGRVYTRQGLSLSLNSSNPSSIGIQHFQNEFGPSSSRSVNIHHEQGHIRHSRYLIPAQELLNEFCSIAAAKQTDEITKPRKLNSDDENTLGKQSLLSLDLLDLQRRKTKLLQMLEEVDRRYKHYCDQMKSVTSSFESVAGSGAATAYTALASQAMSRHFRCLRDGIVAQLKAVKKAMGEKDVTTPGTVKGETPRLRVLDQTLRQQKALQQMSLMESHPWRPQRGLPERSVSVLRAWLFEHFLHPYPSNVDKHILARQTGLSRSQVSNWFINARVRLWKPMVEEMYIEELKENDGGGGGGASVFPTNEDEKPTHDELVRIDSECLSSIINNSDKNEARECPNLGFGYGAMELDFGAAAAYSGGGVSLTLGLHGGGGGRGVNSLFYSRDHNHHIEDCQTGPYNSLMDNENQTLPYRNLMGAQLLHDLAG